MLKLLVKKQITEIFRSYFYDQKKNRKRSTGSTIAFFVMFGLLMVVLLGGMFTLLSLALCFSLVSAGMGWFYFTIMTLLALLLGVFGSVFNTYSSLYLSKDNDLLLSLPIPTGCIIASRLLSVYLMGLMYSGVVMLPAILVYWICGELSLGSVLGCLLLLASVSVLVLVLSCLLGWVVAKISLKLKNKSFITVLVSLVFFGVYYVFCFRIQYVLQDLIENAVRYGEKIHGAAYPLYVLGQAGAGSYPAMAAITAVSLLLFLLVWRLLSRSFLKIATSSSSSTKVRYRSRPLRAASPDKALLGKEFRRFLSSPNYMLNCGLGIILLPALGIVLLVKRAALLTALPLMSEDVTGFFAVLLAACMCAVIAMIDIAAPSVSLEGKTLWQLQSLPVDPWQPLLAKLRIQWILTLIPTLVCGILAIFAFSFTVPERILILLLPLAYGIFSGMAGLSLGLKFPNLSWTNETAPIKQSASVTIALFGGWGYAIIVGGLYCLLYSFLSAAVYLVLVLALTIILSALLYAWLRKRGTKIFASL